jgi:hypothetical protein
MYLVFADANPFELSLDFTLHPFPIIPFHPFAIEYLDLPQFVLTLTWDGMGNMKDESLETPRKYVKTEYVHMLRLLVCAADIHICVWIPIMANRYKWRKTE